MQVEKLKLKWIVAEPPSGRYRSFEKRGWPNAYHANGNIAASISCEDAYRPANVKTGEHKELTVRIAQWANPYNPKEVAWAWRTLKARFSTLAEAKAAAETFLGQHPEYHPPKEEVK